MTIRRSSYLLSFPVLFCASISCSLPPPPGQGEDATGGSSGAGGSSGGAGVGGTTTGGATGVGGADTGGSPGAGGSTGGAGVGGTTTGGATGDGGTNTGGASAGGSATGGTSGAGGSASGGGTGGGGSQDPELHVYLAVGQSNMQGAAHVPEDPPFHERVQVLQSENCPNDGHGYGYGEWREMFPPIVMCQEGTRPLPDGSGEAPIGLGPADSFAVAMAEAAEPHVTIGIVGAAHGDTSIQQHLPGCTSGCLPDWGNNINGAPVVNGTTPLFEWVVDLAKKAQETGEIKGIIFHQGENDTGDSSWPGQVNEYVTALRSELDLDPAEVPFIAGELPETGCCTSHNDLVRQIPDVVENGHYVSAGPMEDGTVLGDRGDGVHWSTESVIEMGKRYAEKMLEAHAAQ